MTNETNGTNLEVYEQALVVTIFAIFFPLMFTALNDNFIPSQVLDPFWATLVSVVAIVIFAVLSFLVVFYYLHLLYGKKLIVTKPNCKFIREFVWNSGRRILAVGGAPLGLFYAEAFFLFSILEKAFDIRYAYTWASLLYFGVWAFFYIVELYCGRKKPNRRLPLWVAVVCFGFVSLMVVLGLLGIVNPYRKPDPN